MNQIDYKAEVLKVEPSARWDLYYVSYTKYFITTDELAKDGKMIKNSNAPSVGKAWENAYNSLKQQGRIK